MSSAAVNTQLKLTNCTEKAALGFLTLLSAATPDKFRAKRRLCGGRTHTDTLPDTPTPRVTSGNNTPVEVNWGWVTVHIVPHPLFSAGPIGVALFCDGGGGGVGGGVGLYSDF